MNRSIRSLTVPIVIAVGVAVAASGAGPTSRPSNGRRLTGELDVKTDRGQTTVIYGGKTYHLTGISDVEVFGDGTVRVNGLTLEQIVGGGASTQPATRPG